MDRKKLSERQIKDVFVGRGNSAYLELPDVLTAQVKVVDGNGILLKLITLKEAFSL